MSETFKGIKRNKEWNKHTETSHEVRYTHTAGGQGNSQEDELFVSRGGHESLNVFKSQQQHRLYIMLMERSKSRVTHMQPGSLTSSESNEVTSQTYAQHRTHTTSILVPRT